MSTFRAPTSRPVLGVVGAFCALVMASAQIGCAAESPSPSEDPSTARTAAETMTRGDVEQELDRLERTLSKPPPNDAGVTPEHAPSGPPRARELRKNGPSSPSAHTRRQS